MQTSNGTTEVLPKENGTAMNSGNAKTVIPESGNPHNGKDFGVKLAEKIESVQTSEPIKPITPQEAMKVLELAAKEMGYTISPSATLDPNSLPVKHYNVDMIQDILHYTVAKVELKKIEK